ncbi:MAG: ubiquinone biosynthesis regulatory protein kinase UbiB [Legionellales bacterium]|nr:ubiquinone biosynthesis regulatory protein kinase UbiB [Legionellales bacterium]
MQNSSTPLHQQIRCVFAIIILALRNWRVIRILMVYRIPQLLLGPSRILNSVRYLLWPLKSKKADQLTMDERILTAFDQLGPIFIKFAQIISTRVDILPHDIAQALEQLQDKVPPFSSEQAVHIIEHNLNSPLQTVFKNFQKKSIGSASLAQVHTATLKNNRKVIIKLLRPDIQSKITDNLKTLYQFAHIIDNYHPNGRIIRATEVINDYDRAIHNETDLLIEAANCSQMYRNAQQNPIVKIPRVMWKYCYKNMLVTEFVAGIEVYNQAALNAKKANQKKIANNIMMLFLDQTFKDNFFHADMHPGNIIIDCKSPDQPIVQLVDFGIVGSLTETDQLYIAQNLMAFFNRDYQRIIQLHIESGWIPNIDNQQNMMNEIRAIGEPLYAKPLKDISFGKVLGELLQIARQYQMIVQPQLILLQKTIFNIEALARRCDPDMNLWENAKPYVERWIQSRYSITDSLKTLSEALPKMLYELAHHQRQPSAVTAITHSEPPVAQSTWPYTHWLVGLLMGLVVAQYIL